jgi:hypothetical protein
MHGAQNWHDRSSGPAMDAWVDMKIAVTIPCGTWLASAATCDSLITSLMKMHG